MFPLRGADGLDAVREHLRLDTVCAAALLDPARPIVLAPMAAPFRLSPSLAPGLAELGAFLPYSPLHHELLAGFGGPLVATSGNLSGEPVITDNAEAQLRLAGIADAFLHHDRPIVRPADDPVVRPMAGAVRTLRLGRGLAPLELELPATEPGRLPRPLLATGGHLKVTVALAWDRRVVVSPHIGELDSPRSNDVFNQVVCDLQSLYGVTAEVIACDLHPGYASTRWARARAHDRGLQLIPVQHHAAHAAALAGEHPDVARWLVFAWDGVGYGDDGGLWGGEALAGRPGAWLRRASFRPFRLAGGDRAGREPWRSAAALLWEAGSPVGANFVRDRLVPAGQDREQGSLLQLAHDAWQKGINTHESSAVGRLFDAAAALVLGRQTASFEGQGPMELEAIAAEGCLPLSLPLAADGQGVLRSDWAPLLATLTNVAIAPAERAGIFHETLAQALLDQVVAIRATTAFDAVGLSGGVFQNKRLTERVVARLGQAGIDVRLHEAVPANDGGLSFGQVIETMRKV